MTVRNNSGLLMAMQSDLAGAKTITAVNTGTDTITAVGHGYSNGDIVLLEIDSIRELDKTPFEVMNVATDTFQLVGPDGTTALDMSTMSALGAGTATAKKLTLGISITGVQDFSPSGGDIEFRDTTTVMDTRKTQVVSGVSAMSYALTLQWDPANAGQAAMKAAYEARASKVFKITWPDGAYAMWYGTVGYGGAPGGGNQENTTTQAAIAVSGNLTVSA